MLVIAVLQHVEKGLCVQKLPFAGLKLEVWFRHARHCCALACQKGPLYPKAVLAWLKLVQKLLLQV